MCQTDSRQLRTELAVSEILAILIQGLHFFHTTACARHLLTSDGAWEVIGENFLASHKLDDANSLDLKAKGPKYDR